MTQGQAPSTISTKWMRKHKWLKQVARTPERDLRGHRIALTYHGLAINLLTWIHDIKPFDQDAVGELGSAAPHPLVRVRDLGDGDPQRRHPQRRPAVPQ